MKNKLKQTMTALCAALILMGGFSVPAYAQGTAAEPPTEDATNDSNVVVEEPETPPLTPKGNATLVDDFGGNKQLIAALHDRQIETEARRIVENVKGLGEPDSPEKTHCAVELSPYFVPLATDKDMERLLSMLPYKSLSLSTLEGRHGVYALIDKSERKKEMKQSPPSVRAQLQTEKSPKVPKKTAKSKHHELEV